LKANRGNAKENAFSYLADFALETQDALRHNCVF